MNDTTIQQTEEKIFTSEVSDDALEAAADTMTARPLVATVAFCSGLDSLPGLIRSSAGPIRRPLELCGRCILDYCEKTCAVHSGLMRRVGSIFPECGIALRSDLRHYKHR